MEYSHKFGSNFPDEAIPVGTKKDINDALAPLISQYYKYIEANDTKSAYNLYNRYKDDLEPYIINSAYFNRLEEEIYNVGIRTSEVVESQTIVVSNTEPSSQTTYSHWLKEF